MPRLAALVRRSVLVALAWCASGCFDCGRCIDHEVVIRVRSASGEPVPELRVTDTGLDRPLSCVAGATETVCTGSVYFGDVTIVLEAPGFETVTLERTFPNPNGPNCSCDHRDLDEVVTLSAS